MLPPLCLIRARVVCDVTMLEGLNLGAVFPSSLVSSSKAPTAGSCERWKWSLGFHGGGDFMISWATISFSRDTQLRGYILLFKNVAKRRKDFLYFVLIFFLCVLSFLPPSFLVLFLQFMYWASCTMGTGGPFLWLKRGRGVMLTTYPHLVPRLRMSRSYTSSPPKRLRGM
jgi:hypothetical protein